jgi:hypothetical protein
MNDILAAIIAAIWVLIIVVILEGCGNITPQDTQLKHKQYIGQNLHGLYYLKEFSIRYQDGTVITDKDCGQWDGILNITNDGELYHYVESDCSFRYIMADVVFINQHAISADTGRCKFDMDYLLENDTLITVIPMGVMADYEESQTWEKVQ